MTDKCKGLMGLVFGHKFAPRFSESTSMPLEIKSIAVIHAADVFNASKAPTYNGDVCQRCGAIVNNNVDFGEQS